MHNIYSHIWFGSGSVLSVLPTILMSGSQLSFWPHWVPDANRHPVAQTGSWVLITFMRYTLLFAKKIVITKLGSPDMEPV